MLAEHSNVLNKLSIVLGSQSPRRREILQVNLGLKCAIQPSDFQEDIPKHLCSSPVDYVTQTCNMKAHDLLSKHYQKQGPHILICADTIVVQDQDILEKPNSREHCKWMLSKLSGQKHHVVTAVTLATKKVHLVGDNESVLENSDLSNDRQEMYDMKTFTESTEVEFCSLSDAAIEAYMNSGEPFDKAGGYGIQGIGCSFVRGIRGCYYNVMGFPVHKFCTELIPYLIELEKKLPLI